MWGLIIVGLAAGWDPAPAFLPVLLYGLRFWILKLLVCIFALDSAEAQKPDRNFSQRTTSGKTATQSRFCPCERAFRGNA